MRTIYQHTEALAHAEGEAVYRLCLLLTLRPAKAERAAFQSFLYLAGETRPLSTEEARHALYRFAYRASEDAWYRKGAAPMKKAAFEELAGVTVSDGLWRLMKRSLKRRAAVFLVHGAHFSVQDAARVLGVRRARAEAWLTAEEDAEALCGELAEIASAGAWGEQLADNVLMRWQERNVPLENGLLRFRSAADRLVPYLALAALLLCAAAVWYTSRLAAALGG